MIDTTNPGNDGVASADEAWLDRVLAADAQCDRDHYIDDAGFTARVMDVLPPVVALPAWRKPVVVGLWAVAAVGVAFALPSAALDVGREAYRLLVAQPLSLSGILGTVVALGALTWTGAALALRGNV